LAERGRFITVEGGEGAGKSTQVGLLAAALGRAGVSVLRTREPGGSPGAEEIRGLLVSGAPGRWDALTEALLLSAARRDHVLRTIRPALAAGTWVVCDRFADSTMAYQGHAGGVDRATLETLGRLATDGLRPDLTLVLDLPVPIGLARAARRQGGEDRFERMGGEFHERLRAGFLEIARGDPARCAVIDAAGDPDATHAAILAVIRDRLGAPV
jgi:dTMP kinase